MAEKFIPLSPYSYVADNPIMLNDSTGKDWYITFEANKAGVRHYHILFTGAVVDNPSKHNGRADELAKSIKTMFEKLFNVNEKQGENGAAGFTVDAKAVINVYDDAKSIGYKETLFSIKDRTDEGFGGSQNTVGIAVNGKQISINENYVDGLIGVKYAKTLVHEIGHTGGLKHPKMDYRLYWGGIDGYEKKYFPGPTAHLSETLNFMNQGNNATPTGPTRDQMYRIYNLYRSGKLNSSDINPVYQ